MRSSRSFLPSDTVRAATHELSIRSGRRLGRHLELTIAMEGGGFELNKKLLILVRAIDIT
jgi:hypothetical protein